MQDVLKSINQQQKTHQSKTVLTYAESQFKQEVQSKIPKYFNCRAHFENLFFTFCVFEDRKIRNCQKRVRIRDGVGLYKSKLLPPPHVKIIQSILQAAGSFYSFIYYHTVIVNCLLFTSAGFSKLVLSNVTGGRALSI